MGMSVKDFITNRYAISDLFRDALIILAKAIVCLEEEMKKPKVINLQAVRTKRALIDDLRRGKETLCESIATLLQQLHDIEIACAKIPEVEFNRDANGKIVLWHPQLQSSSVQPIRVAL